MENTDNLKIINFLLLKNFYIFAHAYSYRAI